MAMVATYFSSSQNEYGANLFRKATNYASLGIIVKDSYGSLIIVHTELIPCQRLWMAAIAMLRASHTLI